MVIMHIYIYIYIYKSGDINNIQWDKLRAPPVDTPACDGHMSDCLQDLKPGDHIEIEWKASRDIPYCRFHATASLIRC